MGCTTSKGGQQDGGKSINNSNNNNTAHSSLFANITVTQHDVDRNVWDAYEKIELVALGSTCEIWTVRKKAFASGGSDVVGVRADSVYIMKMISKVQVNKEILQEIQNEISLLQTLDHPNVVRVYETFQDASAVYLIMEYLKGGDLWSRKGYTEAQAAEILLQICSAVAYCHSNGVIHRDLKMENVIFDNKNDECSTNQHDDLTVTLIDFGLSQRYVQSKQENKTMTEICGTLYTMAPEILKKAYTEKADMWAIGVIAYILLSGTQPFTAKTDKQLMQQIYTRGAVSYEGPEWKNISKEAKQFVESLLQYDPSKRKSADKALQSPWLVKYHDQSRSLRNNSGCNSQGLTMNNIEQSLVKACAESKLQKVAKMIIAYRYDADDLKELRAAFDAMDSGNSGTITYQEFKQALLSNHSNCYTDAELRKMFRDLDVNDNGVLNYTEFLASTLEARGKIEEGMIAAAFEKLDIDKTGYITKQELCKVLNDNCALVDGCSPTIDTILRELDKDGDGKISYEEFVSLFQHQPANETSLQQTPSS